MPAQRIQQPRYRIISIKAIRKAFIRGLLTITGGGSCFGLLLSFAAASLLRLSSTTFRFCMNFSKNWALDPWAAYRSPFHRCIGGRTRFCMTVGLHREDEPNASISKNISGLLLGMTDQIRPRFMELMKF